MAGRAETEVTDFSFFTAGGGLYYRCGRLPVPHAFGTDSGVFDVSRLTMLHQVHGTEIFAASVDDTGRSYEGYDALVTADGRAVIACRTADCVPILMADAESGVCAAVHAGWKGTAAGIAPKVFRRMTEIGARPGRIIVAIGACARYDSYEVGEDLYEAFVNSLGRGISDRHIRLHPSGRLHADIPGVDRELLISAGAREENIFDCGMDTITDARFRSYRREGKREPMLNVISLDGAIPYAG